MPPATRILQSSSSHPPSGEPPEPMTVDSDVVVILAALLCALICVVGLALVARCAWLRRSLGGTLMNPPPPNKGLKKKALRALPKISFEGMVAAGGKLADCPICLAEFVQGEEIRILPQCGHGFHVSCVDAWLGSNSTCPSCRQILIVAAPSRCDRCGASAIVAEDRLEGAMASSTAENGAKAREDGEANSRTRILPPCTNYGWQIEHSTGDHSSNGRRAIKAPLRGIISITTTKKRRKDDVDVGIHRHWLKGFIDGQGAGAFDRRFLAGGILKEIEISLRREEAEAEEDDDLGF